ncbi:hypothetical protein ABIB15_001725 [Marisediminicola sp. UYEF4]
MCGCWCCGARRHPPGRGTQRRSFCATPSRLAGRAGVLQILLPSVSSRLAVFSLGCLLAWLSAAAGAVDAQHPSCSANDGPADAGTPAPTRSRHSTQEFPHHAVSFGRTSRRVADSPAERLFSPGSLLAWLSAAAGAVDAQHPSCSASDGPADAGTPAPTRSRHSTQEFPHHAVSFGRTSRRVADSPADRCDQRDTQPPNGTRAPSHPRSASPSFTRVPVRSSAFE